MFDGDILLSACGRISVNDKPNCSSDIKQDVYVYKRCRDVLSERNIHINRKIITYIFRNGTHSPSLRYKYVNTPNRCSLFLRWCWWCSRNVQFLRYAIKSTSQFSASLCYGLFGTPYDDASCTHAAHAHFFVKSPLYAMMWAWAHTLLRLTHAMKIFFFAFFASSAIVHFDRQVFCVCTRRRRRDNKKKKIKICVSLPKSVQILMWK